MWPLGVFGGGDVCSVPAPLRHLGYRCIRHRCLRLAALCVWVKWVLRQQVRELGKSAWARHTCGTRHRHPIGSTAVVSLPYRPHILGLVALGSSQRASSRKCARILGPVASACPGAPQDDTVGHRSVMRRAPVASAGAFSFSCWRPSDMLCPPRFGTLLYLVNGIFRDGAPRDLRCSLLDVPLCGWPSPIAAAHSGHLASLSRRYRLACLPPLFLHHLLPPPPFRSVGQSVRRFPPPPRKSHCHPHPTNSPMLVAGTGSMAC